MHRILFVTGARADFGLLAPLMARVRDAPDMTLLTLVTGAHLSPQFGMTVDEVEAAGFRVDERVEMLLSGDTPAAISKSIGLGVIGCADAIRDLRPDLLMVLGDRYEVLAAAIAATCARVPIGHIHGGEVTEGAIDEAIRHTITKMAYLHFTAAEPFRARVIQLGEAPERVFDCGALAVDTIARLELLPRAEIEGFLGGFSLKGSFFLVTYHSTTLLADEGRRGLEALLSAFDRFPAARIIFTGVNADTDHHGLGARISQYVKASGGRATMAASLGHRRYLSAMHHADAVIGNSSSGIIEAPAVGTPSVNIGNRQRGRPLAPSVIGATTEATAIAEAIETALTPEFVRIAAARLTPYGTPGAPDRILAILRERLPVASVDKSFFDLAALPAG